MPFVVESIDRANRFEEALFQVARKTDPWPMIPPIWPDVKPLGDQSRPTATYLALGARSVVICCL
jgi:hypothetical protein